MSGASVLRFIAATVAYRISGLGDVACEWLVDDPTATNPMRMPRVATARIYLSEEYRLRRFFKGDGRIISRSEAIGVPQSDAFTDVTVLFCGWHWGVPLARSSLPQLDLCGKPLCRCDVRHNPVGDFKHAGESPLFTDCAMAT